ncbi:hypothetical protein CRENBAI_026138 [Crenichthys baileyi]|uniref:Uncharacterized protein n=1 Tax=Crenichthys baileyi TaxID=28760 RepID=A0AAV9RSU5_9TELE
MTGEQWICASFSDLEKVPKSHPGSAKWKQYRWRGGRSHPLQDSSCYSTFWLWKRLIRGQPDFGQDQGRRADDPGNYNLLRQYSKDKEMSKGC